MALGDSGVLEESTIVAPDHEVDPAGLGGEDVGSGSGADFAERDGLAGGEGEHVGVVLLLEFTIYIDAKDVGDGAGVAAGSVDVPDPDEIVEVVEVDEAVVELTIKGGGSIFAGTASPPEPVAVHLGAEED